MQVSERTPAVISGGASGLGAASARALAARGAKVALLDLNAEAGHAVAAEVGGLFVATDVTDPASVAAALAQAAEAHGPARIAMTCAGIVAGQRTVGRDGVAHDPALFRRVIDVNLIGTMLLATQAAAGMAALPPVTEDGTRGVIITTASIAATDGQIGQIAYAASKGAVAAMTLPLARDLAGVGIRVACLSPGMFATPMVDGLPSEVQEALGAAVPFPQRLGDPGEYAAMALALIENPMVNGATLRLDGAIRLPPK